MSIDACCIGVLNQTGTDAKSVESGEIAETAATYAISGQADGRCWPDVLRVWKTLIENQTNA